MNENDSSGLNMFARVMQSRMQAVADSPPAVDIGEIVSGYSLKTSHFPVPIPEGDYFICRGISANPKEGAKEILIEKNNIEGEHDHGGVDDHEHDYDYWGEGGVSIDAGGAHSHPDVGAHTHTVPKKFRKIEIGDKVLVVWAGNNAVVVDIVIPAKYLKEVYIKNA